MEKEETDKEKRQTEGEIWNQKPWVEELWRAPFPCKHSQSPSNEWYSPEPHLPLSTPIVSNIFLSVPQYPPSQLSYVLGMSEREKKNLIIYLDYHKNKTYSF